MQDTSLGMLEIGENSKRYVGLMKFKSGLHDVFQSAQDVLPTYEARMTLPTESVLPQLKVFYSGRYFQCPMDPVYDSEDSSGKYGAYPRIKRVLEEAKSKISHIVSASSKTRIAFFNMNLFFSSKKSR